MLDISLHGVSFAFPGFALRGIGLTFPRSTHTAIIGPPGSGASTLLRLITGYLRPDEGSIHIGARAVERIKQSARPILAVPEQVPARWSVQHALVAAVRQRTLDRIDRHREYELAVQKWRLAPILDRKIATLSTSEALVVQLARIELLRPGIVVADRLFTGANPALLSWAPDEIYRALRVMGTTIVSSPAATTELGWADRVVALNAGAVVQQGSPSKLFSEPLDESVAAATGDVNLIPVRIRGRNVESMIGNWELEHPPFEGTGVALARPDDFSVARPGEDSDLIFGVEEAAFQEGRWMARGILSGGFMLRVTLPRATEIHKGKLLALRYDPLRFSLISRNIAFETSGAPLDAMPPMRETR